MHREFIRNALKIKKDSVTEKVVISIVSIIIIITFVKSNIIQKIIIPKKEKEYTEEDNIQNNSITINKQPTLEEYLSKLFCNGCGRRCLLTNPGCSRGIGKQQEEIQEYNQTYNTNETYTSSGKRKH